MKTNSIALKILPKLFDVLRVLTLIFTGVALLAATIKFSTSDYLEVTNYIRVDRQPIKTNIVPNSDEVKDINIVANNAAVKASFKRSFFTVFPTYLYLISFGWVLFIQFRTFRDFFYSIKNGTPFDPDNIKRLQIIGYTFLGLTFIEIAKHIVMNITFSHFINDIRFSAYYWSVGLSGVMWAIVTFIIADVFKYGFTLKKENEEFV